MSKRKREPEVESAIAKAAKQVLADYPNATSAELLQACNVFYAVHKTKAAEESLASFRAFKAQLAAKSVTQ